MERKAAGSHAMQGHDMTWHEGAWIGMECMQWTNEWMKWNEMKWNEMKWNEMKWNEMNEMNEWMNEWMKWMNEWMKWMD